MYVFTGTTLLSAKWKYNQEYARTCMALSGEKVEQAFGSQIQTGKPLICKMRPTCKT